MARRKVHKPVEPPPSGCSKCKGRPWVERYDDRGNFLGMGRCSCPRGTWYIQKERPRLLKRQLTGGGDLRRLACS